MLPTCGAHNRPDHVKHGRPGIKLNAANLSDNRWHYGSNDEYVYGMNADPDIKEIVYAANAAKQPTSRCPLQVVFSFDAISAV